MAAPGDLPQHTTLALGMALLDLIERRERTHRGVAPDAPTSGDGRLVEAACAALGKARRKPFTRGELAAALGIPPGSQTTLSPARLAKYGLKAAVRDQLVAWIAQA